MRPQIEDFEKSQSRVETADDALRQRFRPGDDPALSEKEGVAQGDWVDRGIQETPVEAVDLSDSYVHSEADFKKVSHEEMVRGFETLEKEVRPAVANGADGDYFSRLDEQRGLEHKDGTRRVYDAFYGDSAIRLNKVGDRYEVVNGYHRLHVANELGVSAVPARVIEKGDSLDRSGIDGSQLHGSAWEREQQAIEKWAENVPEGPQAYREQLNREMGWTVDKVE